MGVSSSLDGVAGVGNVRHMLGINMLDEGRVPDQEPDQAQDTFSVSMAQPGALSSKASAPESASSGSDRADMHVWVDAGSTTLTVLSSSSDFALLAGPKGPC